MIRIVGLQRDDDVRQEFVLLQNQCAMRINLRGHALVSECALDGERTGVLHLFADDAHIPPGGYVILHTGSGTPGFAKTRDGACIYSAYMGRERPVWDGSHTGLMLLHPQHSYSLKKPDAILV